MRPIKLTINAFGSYLKLAEIDFDRLGEYHLFLINGATGSGKTTIFDALVYALYGEVSGSSRNQREVKSQYATDQDLSYVELEFEVRGEIYRIYRQPAQQGPGARGGRKRVLAKPVACVRVQLLRDGGCGACLCYKSSALGLGLCAFLR